MDPRRVVSVILGDESDNDLDGSDEEQDYSFCPYSRQSFVQGEISATHGCPISNHFR